MLNMYFKMGSKIMKPKNKPTIKASDQSGNPQQKQRTKVKNIEINVLPSLIFGEKLKYRMNSSEFIPHSFCWSSVKLISSKIFSFFTMRKPSTAKPRAIQIGTIQRSFKITMDFKPCQRAKRTTALIIGISKLLRIRHAFLNFKESNLMKAISLSPHFFKYSTPKRPIGRLFLKEDRQL